MKLRILQYWELLKNVTEIVVRSQSRFASFYCSVFAPLCLGIVINIAYVISFLMQIYER